MRFFFNPSTFSYSGFPGYRFLAGWATTTSKRTEHGMQEEEERQKGAGSEEDPGKKKSFKHRCEDVVETEQRSKIRRSDDRLRIRDLNVEKKALRLHRFPSTKWVILRC